MDMSESMILEGKRTSQQIHYRTELNNIVIKRKYVLQWGLSWEGPPHDPQWTAVVFVNGQQCASAVDKTKGGAKEKASKVAYELLEIRDEPIKMSKPDLKKKTSVEDNISKSGAGELAGEGLARRKNEPGRPRAATR
ncbi:hypothetical protein H0H81_003610 [Sphagnurus paluster]|uniref:DRBM domain-containing protein n=1 Tax=Sphagnurus paluster TaxID=117069 RepID=A0A9P7K627_9AGAR|nr:hypothetical protein H0H81_003610 [Sphagnurus paluster]